MEFHAVSRDNVRSRARGGEYAKAVTAMAADTRHDTWELMLGDRKPAAAKCGLDNALKAAGLYEKGWRTRSSGPHVWVLRGDAR